MPMQPVLHPAQSSELESLTELVTAYRREEKEPFDHSGVAKALSQLIERPELGRAWLIRLEEKDIGYLLLCFGFSLEFLGRDAFIDELFIVPEHRGRGVGTQILQQTLQEAAALGVKMLHLEVEHGNTPAERLYRSLGFIGREKYYLMSTPLAEAAVNPAKAP